MKTTPQNINYICKDNAGIKRCRSVNSTIVCNSFGNVLASLTKVVPAKKYKKGDLTSLVVFGRKRSRLRRSGFSVKLDYNGVIAVKKDNSPIGTRVYAPVYLESRHFGYARLAVICRNLL